MGPGRMGAGPAREETGSRLTGNGIGLTFDEGSGEGEAFDLSPPPEAGTGAGETGTDGTGTDSTGKDGPDADGTGAKEPVP